jgi:hypothetical protein
MKSADGPDPNAVIPMLWIMTPAALVVGCAALTGVPSSAVVMAIVMAWGRRPC